MKITILCVGKLKEKYLKAGVDEYIKRITRFSSVEVIEVEDEKAAESLSAKEEEQVKIREMEKLQKRMKDRAYKIVLDVGGQNLTSQEFAEKLEGVLSSGKSHIECIIGGSLGYPEGFAQTADLRLSLSKMTFPHQLARVVLLEQIYRAFKIIHHETYHK